MAGGGDDLKLLGMWASPFMMRAKLALGFKGLSYQDVEEDIFDGKSELLLSSNPVHKKVPVLLHDGRPVCESQIIVQYIDESQIIVQYEVGHLDVIVMCTRCWL